VCVCVSVWILQLVDSEQYERYLMLSLQEAESRAADSYHCQTLDCPGMCVYIYSLSFTISSTLIFPGSDKIREGLTLDFNYLVLAPPGFYL